MYDNRNCHTFDDNRNLSWSPSVYHQHSLIYTCWDKLIGTKIIVIDILNQNGNSMHFKLLENRYIWYTANYTSTADFIADIILPVIDARRPGYCG